jgi:hypothetical protein
VRANRLAVRALTLAVVSLAVPVVPAVVALALAVRAARQTRDGPRTAPGGRGLVTAAVALASVSLIVWTGLVATVTLVPTGHKEPMAVATALDVVAADTAPTTTVPRQTTGGDRRWLEAVQKLQTRLYQPFEAPFDLTPAKAASLARLLGGCGRELARLGSPSDRLREVDELVKQAWVQYRKSARCFAAFASAVGATKQGQAVDCAAAAQEEGSALLVQAAAEGEAIMELPADPDPTLGG